MVKKLFPDPFLKNRNWGYLWINSLKFYTVCFDCMPSWGSSKYIGTKLQTSCFYSYKTFLKIKKRSGTSLSGSFSHDFLRKIFILLFFITWPSFIAWMSLRREILGNNVYYNCWPGCEGINFKINLTFLIKPFFLHAQAVETKIKYLENEKSL